MKSNLATLILLTFIGFNSWATEGRFASNFKNSTQVDAKDRHLNDYLILRLAEPHRMADNEIHIDVLFRLGQQWTLGPTFALMGDGEHIHAGAAVYNRENYRDSTSRRQYGAKLSYYFRHVNVSSAYVTLHGRYAHTEISSHGITNNNPSNGFTSFEGGNYGVVLGYQWQTGMIKLFLGGGFQQHIAPNAVVLSYPNGTAINLELTSSNHAEFVVDGGLGLTF